MIDIQATVRRAPFLKGARRIPYEHLAREVLGSRYELSLVICSDALAQRMNREYRKKSYAPNVLSFPLSTSEGEIFVNVRKAERDARAFGVGARERMALLFVHGLYHLKGMRHGSAMEKKEEALLRRFNLS